MGNPKSAGVPGLKDDPIPPFTPQETGVGFGWLVQMLIALAIVVAIVRFVVPKYAQRFAICNKGFETPDLRVKHSVNVGNGQIFIVEARGRSLLIGSTLQGLSLLADLTDEEEFATTPIPSFLSQDFDAMLTRLNRLEN